MSFAFARERKNIFFNPPFFEQDKAGIPAAVMDRRRYIDDEAAHSDNDDAASSDAGSASSSLARWVAEGDAGAVEGSVGDGRDNHPRNLLFEGLLSLCCVNRIQCVQT